jgi:hypothetical protein
MLSRDNGILGPAAYVMGVAEGADAGEALVRAADRLIPRLPIDPSHLVALKWIMGAAAVKLGQGPFPLVSADAVSSPGRLLCWAYMLADRERTPAAEALLLAKVALPDPLLRYTALRAMPQDFATRHQLPWLALFTDPGSSDCNVSSLAVLLSRAADPAVIKAALIAIPTAIWDGHQREDFERRLREVTAPAK